eukprot:CAMPEP_0201686430 /NCGR_PEP_ID=MMETSP0578-20130828/878_1 /ASSEMBLY_ACC=CAM_ASM_000663 /TAXON_ID=267565 /ORGANISM="Skeletonema grethea, Strain CCMP 1804" /LENGTH=295 /DNA_ID=CAMNT_0048170487 /DNA_START=62 /DNA_END=949 /DNA_ORIENTATION=+
MLTSQITLLFLLFLISYASAQTAVVFGGSGAVGSEVLKSVLSDDFFTKVIVVGRPSSSKKINDIVSSTASEEKVTNINLDRVEDILFASTSAGIERADACLIALGVSSPHHSNLQQWLSIEIDLIGTIAEFCNKIKVRSITLLSAVDVENESAVPFTKEEIASYGEGSLGWIKMIMLYMRVKGLEEKAVIENASDVQYIRLFQPNTILTDQTRYGWFDAILFRLHGLLDPLLPAQYHSVHVRLLGAAMVADAKRKLQDKEGDDTQQDIAKLTYEDYVSVAGKAFQDSLESKREEL